MIDWWNKDINLKKLIEIQSRQIEIKLYRDNKKIKHNPKVKKLGYNRTRNK